MTESPHIKILEEIIPTLAIEEKYNNEIEYCTDNGGTFIGFGLHKEKAVAVQRVFMSKGTEIPEHQHPEHEYCLVYKGSFKIKRGEASPARMGGEHTYEKEGILGVGDGVYFQPEEPHSGEMLEDTWIISTTIPASMEYPDV